MYMSVVLHSAPQMDIFTLEAKPLVKNMSRLSNQGPGSLQSKALEKFLGIFLAMFGPSTITCYVNLGSSLELGMLGFFTFGRREINPSHPLGLLYVTPP